MKQGFARLGCSEGFVGNLWPLKHEPPVAKNAQRSGGEELSFLESMSLGTRIGESVRDQNPLTMKPQFRGAPAAEKCSLKPKLL